VTTDRKRLNPLLGLPAAQELTALLGEQPEIAAAFCRLLTQLGEQADHLAEHAWQKRKAPMAAYWRACAVYARHIARAVGKSEKKDSLIKNGPAHEQ
jgi:hypothetical protein